MRTFVLIILLILAGAIFSSFFIFTQPLVDKKTCFADTDCVPDQCCHASDVVNRIYAPNCAGAICTMECRGGTMDCGCGKPVCVDGKCQVLKTGNFDYC